ncbi:MAG: thioredoxin family protein [Oscillatoriaceae cyanobacterium]
MTANLPNPSPEPTLTPAAKALRNFLIVMAAVILSVALFLGLRTDTTSISLPELAAESVPLEVALSNGKPTMMEFYANWCTSCQAMAPELEELKQHYQDQINFVMLNVDNSKWLPEILKYRVDGIPHFVFLTPNGAPVGSAIGEIPRSIMEENLISLAAGNPLPHTNSTGQTSAFEAPVTATSASASDPRSHGSQVQSGDN